MGKNNSDAQRRRDCKNVGVYYKRKFKWLKTCIYCGEIATCKDHVFPVSKAAQLDFLNERVLFYLKKSLYIVPSCSSCNLIASNKPFDSILSKRHFIQEALYKKNKKYVRTVIWEKEEIEELGYNLKSSVIEMLSKRHKIEKRINYPRGSSLPLDVIEIIMNFKNKK